MIFSAAMVQALLARLKWQTRRIVRGVGECPHGYDQVKGVELASVRVKDGAVQGLALKLAGGATVRCPYDVGDRVWVRETFAENMKGAKVRFTYRAETNGDHPSGHRWTPAIHMPRKACRLVLEVVRVHAERLQAISDADAKAEGADHIRLLVGGRVEFRPSTPGAFDTRPLAFRALWDSLNGDRGYGWKTNPWVWVVEFRRAAA